MKMLIKFLQRGMNVLITLVVTGMFFSGFGIASAQSTKEQQKKLIYINYITHQENSYINDIPKVPGKNWTMGPQRYATNAKNIINNWGKHGIKGEYATMGVALQQLADEYPEMIEEIKRLKLPVSRYCGVGHSEPGPVGHLPDFSGMNLDEAIQALWNYETHTLIPNWHFEDGKFIIGNPRAGEPITLEELPEYNLPKNETWLYGGTLAIERLLGVIPLDFFQGRFRNLGRDEDSCICPMNAVRRALGMGSYEVSYNKGTPFSVGLDPQYLAENWPRDVEIYTKGAGGAPDYLLAHPEDFKVVWPDPEANQWKTENSALKFFKKTYSVDSFEKVLNMECPVEYIKQLMTKEEKDRLLSIIKRQTEVKEMEEKEGYESWERRLLTADEAKDWLDYLMSIHVDRRDVPSYLKEPQENFEQIKGRLKSFEKVETRRTLANETIINAAKYLMYHWPNANHDGDFDGPPDYVEAGREYLTLSEAFEAFAFTLEYYAIKERIPKEITIKEILGPIDYPQYRLEEEPKLDPEKVIGIRGWQPYELKDEYWPDTKIITRQGLIRPLTDDHPHRPYSITANEVTIMQAAVDASRFIRENGHIPGIIKMFLPPRESRENEEVMEVEMWANSAELLYAMAQLCYKLYSNSFPNSVKILSAKIIKDQKTRYVVHSSPISYMGGRLQVEWMNTGFIWREWVPVWMLNNSWTYKP